MDHSTSSPAARSLRVLYAEDLVLLRDLFAQVLTKAGHTVESAPDGLGALSRLRAGVARYDVLLTDHQMPGLDGLELVRAARELAFAGRIVVLSSKLGAAEQARYRALGVDAMLPKPIFPATLIDVFATLPAEAAKTTGWIEASA